MKRLRGVERPASPERAQAGEGGARPGQWPGERARPGSPGWLAFGVANCISGESRLISECRSGPARTGVDENGENWRPGTNPVAILLKTNNNGDRTARARKQMEAGISGSPAQWVTESGPGGYVERS